MILIIIASAGAEPLFKATYAPSLQIRVGDHPVGISYNPENGDVYVANSGSNNLAIINGDTNKLESRILVGRSPYAITYDPANDYLYVVNVAENSTSVINTDTNKIIKTIQVGGLPSALGYDVVNQRVYVANYDSNILTVINSSNQVIANVSVGRNPIDLTYNPFNRGIYVANAGDDTVSVINTDTNTLITNITVGDYPTSVIYSPANDRIYVANRNSDTISVIHGVTNKVLEDIKVPQSPLGLAVNPNTTTIYVSHTQAKTPLVDNMTPYSISVINGITNTLTKEIGVTARPEAMAMNLKNNLLYVTNPSNNSISVIDSKTNSVVQISSVLPEHAKFTALADLLLITIIPIILIAFLLSRGSRKYVRKKLNYMNDHVSGSKTVFFEFLRKLFRLIRKSWIRSGLTLTILSLIVMPVLVVLSLIHYDQINEFYSQFSQHKGLEWERTYSFYINLFVQVAFVVMLVLYPPYPAPFSSEQYFLNRGFHAAVVEFDYVKKILYIAVPLFILMTIIPGIKAQLEPLAEELSINLNTQLEHPTYLIAQGIVFFIVSAGLLKLVFAVARKKFRLYYAIGCFRIIERWEEIENASTQVALDNIDHRRRRRTNPKDEVQKMSYVIKGLNSYNSYLLRHLDLHINDIKSLYSKISKLPIDRKNEVIKDISKIFTSDSLETNSLEPARYLYKFSTEEKDKSKKEARKEGQEEQETMTKEGFLVARPLFEKLRDWSALAAVIIPLGIAMIELYLRLRG